MGSRGERGCGFCGGLPTIDAGGGRAWCERHAREYRSDPCASCGRVVVRHHSVPVEPCSDCRDTAWLARLASEQVDAIDRLVRARAWVEAIRLVRAMDSRLGLYDAQSIVWARKRALRVSTDPPLPSIEELVARVAELVPAPVVIEAVWDGDTIRDWFVVLVAVVPSPSGLADRTVATITSEAGAVSARATEVGQAIAARLSIPFHFASPDQPDDRAPRWSAPRGG